MNNKTNILDSFTLLFAKLYAENVINKAFYRHAVASFMGAWIKTPVMRCIRQAAAVASFMGAWIKTDRVRIGQRIAQSHPLWVRGLKR